MTRTLLLSLLLLGALPARAQVAGDVDGDDDGVEAPPAARDVDDEIDVDSPRAARDVDSEIDVDTPPAAPDSAAPDGAAPDGAAPGAGRPAAKKPAAKKPADDDDDEAADADEGADDEGDEADGEGEGKTEKGAQAKREGPQVDPLTAFRAGRYAEARDGYLAQLTERPDAPALHYRIAVSAALADDPTLAERHAAATERLDPGNGAAVQLAAAARVARTRAQPITADQRAAALALRDGRLRAAARLARAALGGEAADPGALHRIEGQALLALGRADEASDAFKAAAGHGQYDPALWLSLGDAARLLGDAEGAAWLYAIATQSAAAQDPINQQAEARRARLGAARKR